MEESFDARIEDLRRQSRTLIHHLEETSRRVDEEVCRMRSQSSSQDRPAKSHEYWRMRNDSCGVGGVLCPDYFRSRGSEVERRPGRAKIVITSGKQPARKPARKPVRGCYCSARTRKSQAERTTDESSFPCARCRSKFDLVEVDSSEDAAANDLYPALPPLRGKTLRRVEKITYSPTSEFLRRVQNKVSCQKKRPDDRCGYSTSDSSSRERLARDSGRGESTGEIFRTRCRMGKKISSSRRGEFRSRSETRMNRRVDDRRSLNVRDENGGSNSGGGASTSYRRSRRSSSACAVDRRPTRRDEGSATGRDREPRRKPGSSVKKKSARSADRPNDEERRKKNPTKVKRIVRTISAQSRCCGEENCGVATGVGARSRRNGEKSRVGCDCGTRECPKVVEGHRPCTAWQLTRDTDRPIDGRTNDSRDRVSDLKKFRQDNYFETHGSARKLVDSSRSSGSVEQYELNDRLFPEPVRRIHRDDLIVTMPPCATKQRKRIHYFPRNIVGQERSVSNTNYKKKRRSQSCGLTGHAVDLGVFKIPRDVSNSLALKYQKGVAQYDK